MAGCSPCRCGFDGDRTSRAEKLSCFHDPWTTMSSQRCSFWQTCAWRLLTNYSADPFPGIRGTKPCPLSTVGDIRRSWVSPFNGNPPNFSRESQGDVRYERILSAQPFSPSPQLTLTPSLYSTAALALEKLPANAPLGVVLLLFPDASRESSSFSADPNS